MPYNDNFLFHNLDEHETPPFLYIGALNLTPYLILSNPRVPLLVVLKGIPPELDKALGILLRAGTANRFGDNPKRPIFVNQHMNFTIHLCHYADSASRSYLDVQARHNHCVSLIRMGERWIGDKP